MKREEENQEQTGWLLTVEFVTAATDELVKKERFLVYSKKSKAIDPLSTIIGAVVLEIIAANTDRSYKINLRQTDRLVEVAMTKELLDEPVYYETDQLAVCKTLPLTSLRIWQTSLWLLRPYLADYIALFKS